MKMSPLGQKWGKNIDIREIEFPWKKRCSDELFSLVTAVVEL